MTHAISSFTSKVYKSLPSLKIDTFSSMIKKATKIAIPAILVLGAQSVQCADALLSAIICVTCLAGGGGPICIPPCIIAAVLLPVPIA